MEQLGAAIALLEALDDDSIDPGELSSFIDRMQGKLCRVLASAEKRGDHLTRRPDRLLLGRITMPDLQASGG